MACFETWALILHQENEIIFRSAILTVAHSWDVIIYQDQSQDSDKQTQTPGMRMRYYYLDSGSRGWWTTVWMHWSPWDTWDRSEERGWHLENSGTRGTCWWWQSSWRPTRWPRTSLSRGSWSPPQSSARIVSEIFPGSLWLAQYDWQTKSSESYIWVEDQLLLQRSVSWCQWWMEDESLVKTVFVKDYQDSRHVEDYWW